MISFAPASGDSALIALSGLADFLSVNVNRRHMTAAQWAMATAFIYPVSDEKGGSGEEVEQNRSETNSLGKLAYSKPLAESA